MNIFKEKTIYIYKEKKRDRYFTVLLSHPFYSYGLHSINRFGIPYYYFTEIDDTFREVFKEYKIVFRKPNNSEIRKLQHTVFLCALNEKAACSFKY